MNTIRNLIIRFSQVEGLRRGLLLLYRAVYALARIALAGQARVVLRRPGVFRDGIPGLSDLDLTIVMPASLSPAQRQWLTQRVRRLKKVFPVIGEIWLVPETLWSSHRALFSLDYGDDESTTSSRVMALAHRRRRELEMFRFSRPEEPRVHSRLQHKARWLEAIADGQAALSLNYRNAIGGGNPYALIAPPSAQEEISVQVRGRHYFPREEERQELVMRAGDRISREMPCELRLVPFRPGLFLNTLQVKIPDGALASPKLFSSLQQLTTAREYRSLGLTPAHPILWTAAQWEAYQTADPFFNLVSDRKLTREALELEIAEHLNMLYSVRRANETNFFLDTLLMLVALSETEARGTFQCDVRENLENARAHWELDIPLSVETLYLTGDLDALDRLPLTPLWEQAFPAIARLTHWGTAVLPRPSVHPSSVEQKTRSRALATAPSV